MATVSATIETERNLRMEFTAPCPGLEFEEM